MWPESNYDGPEWVMGLVIIIMGVMVRYHFKIKEAKEKEMNKRILDQWEESPKELSDTNNEEGVGNPPIPPRETP